MKIIGRNFLGYELSSEGKETFRAFEPLEGNFLPEEFYTATPDEVERAMTLAKSAFTQSVEPNKRADFLEAVAKELQALGDDLITRANQETGLPRKRLDAERDRTVKQLTQFAALIREGSWINATIDRGKSAAPDLRKLLIPLGPVVVFGSSNFPFAYSVAGVDPGPAWAAGCPVVVKAHPAHPGVSDLTAQAIVTAAKETQMPEGIFSMLYDDGFEVGTALVKHPATKAVAFTGSFSGGMALHKIAQQREEPIPVFAEMGSVNPVVILPEAIEKRAEYISEKLAASVTLDAGQFCTNPGIAFVIEGEGLDRFVESYQNAVAKVPSVPMLTRTMNENFFKLRDEALGEKGVSLLVKSELVSPGKTQSQASVATVSGKNFIQNPKLKEEVFGPFSLLVICRDHDELRKALLTMKGQLTASLFAEKRELAENQLLIHALCTICGRFILNGVPTGVEVCASMQHGGPFPATTDAHYSSVGAQSIYRFVRPQVYQNWPDEFLPVELQNANPKEIFRLVENIWTRDPLQ